MNKKLFLILTVFITTLLITNVYAVTMPPIQTPDDAATLTATITNILGYLKWISFVAAVGVMVFLGIRYTMATVNERAEIKNALVMYGLGAIMIAGSFQIVSILYSAFK
jgi:hypothetical protein